ncbi:MAG: dephospho-CoA kinase [Oscillospiraceae bacterium]
MVNIIGLTGQSGAGKTTICKAFEKNNFKIINCDKIARKATEKHTEGLIQIINYFGEDVLNSDNTLNRKALSSICFNNKEKLNKLNSILHPIIFNLIKTEISKFENDDYVVLDAPTLFESGADKLCDKIISVICDEKIRFERIMKRDNISNNEIENRFKSQKNEDFFISNSDFIIKNDKNIEYALNQVEKVINEIKK